MDFQREKVKMDKEMGRVHCFAISFNKWNDNWKNAIYDPLNNALCAD